MGYTYTVKRYNMLVKEILVNMLERGITRDLVLVDELEYK